MAIDFTAIFRAIADFSSVDKASKKTSENLKAMPWEETGKKSGTFGDKTASSLDKVSKKSQKVGKDMSIGITAPVVLLATKAVQSFANFESSITSAGAKSGATADQIAQMKDVALDMGAKTKFSAGQAATAMDNMAAAGFDANAVMAAIPGVMLAAQAAGEDLGLTADVTAKAINAFGLKAEDATHVADVFTTASNNSALGMQGLADALSQAGELGAKAGQGLEDVVAFVARLVDQGVPAASAGVAVRQAITSLIAPSKKGAKVLAALGLSFRDANGDMLPIPDILDKLALGMSSTNPLFDEAAAAAGKSGAEYADWAQQALFGVEGSKAITLALSEGKPLMLDAAKDTEKLAQLTAGLAKTMGKDGAEAWVKARTKQGQFTASSADAVRAMGAMGKASDGTAKKIGDIMADTTKARMDQLGGAFETLSITLITILAPALTSILKKVTNFVNGFAEFAKAHPLITKIGAAFVLILAILGPLLVVFGAIAGAVSAIVALGAPVLLVIGIIIAAIIALIAIGILLYKNWDTIVKFLRKIWQAIAAFAKSVWGSITKFLGEQWTSIAALAKSVWGAIAAFFSGVWSGVVSVWRSVWGAIAGFFTGIWNGIKMAASLALAALLGVINALLAPIKASWAAFWGTFGGLITAAWQLVVAIVRLGLALMYLVFQVGMSTISSFLSAAWTFIANRAKEVWNALAAAAAAVWGLIVAYIITPVRNLIGALVAIWNTIKARTVTAWNNTKTAAIAVWNAITNAIRAAVAAIWGKISGPINAIKSALAAAWNAVKSAVTTAWNAVAQVVATKVLDIYNKVKSIQSKITGALSNAGSWLLDAGKRIIQGLIDGITSKISALTSKLNSITDKIPDWKGPAEVDAKLLYRSGQLIMGGLNAGIEKGTGTVEKTLNDLTAAIPAKMQDALSGMAGTVAMSTSLAATPGLAQMAALKTGQAAAMTAPSVSGTGMGTPMKKAAAGEAGKTVIVNLTANNPVGESTAETTTKQVTRLAALGVV